MSELRELVKDADSYYALLRTITEALGVSVVGHGSVFTVRWLDGDTIHTRGLPQFLQDLMNGAIKKNK
jgi:hypothetical protein